MTVVALWKARWQPPRTVIHTLFFRHVMAHKRLEALSHKGLNLGAPKPADPMFVGGKTEGAFVPGAAPSRMPGHVGAGPMVATGRLFSCPAGREMPHASTPEARQGGVHPCVGPSVKTVYAALPVLTVVSI